MRTIEITVTMGLQGCKRTNTIEIEDGTSDDEIEEIAQEAMFELISWSWHDIGPAKPKRKAPPR